MSDEEWDFEHQHFKEGTSLSDHLNKFQEIIDQMSGMGIKFEDEILGSLLLNYLPESWETFKVSITNSAPNSVVSLQMVKGSVLNEEMRRKARGFSSQPEKHCFLWKKENKGKNGKSKEKDDDHDCVTTATGDDLVILQDFESIIDSGVTLHVTPRKEFFTSYTACDFGVLKMGNDGVTKVIGVGDVCLQTNTGMQLWLRGVKHAPNVRFNLISVHMLDDGGYDNHFGHGKWKHTKAKKDMLPRLKNAELEKCSHCMTRVSFKKHPPSRKSELLELVHYDVCGPLKALVERQSGKKVKCIRSDNDGEYCGPFDVYCRQQGIRHEKTPPKTLQLNGLAERMNKTLIERVRCMLSEARLPKHFWGEALYTVVHVINLSPVVALNTEVPDKIWFGKDVKYDHLRVFGCKAFVHVPKDERSKLDMKTRQCIFIGYGHDEYGYRMYDPVEKKL
ncbi:hypothetical protein CR513_27693, partial [Mucuna pruriens]